jgi:hypothetical protein
MGQPKKNWAGGACTACPVERRAGSAALRDLLALGVIVGQGPGDRAQAAILVMANRLKLIA